MTICDVAKERIAEELGLGEVAVDATMGNGWDTLFLAEQVGAEGRVFGFDVQESALISTRKKLCKKGVEGICELWQLGHEEMAAKVPKGVGAVMFNLGYLPYADQEMVTKSETTLVALEVARGLLRTGGMLSVICYRGHPGGQEEAKAVWEWAWGLDGEFAVEGPREFPEGEKPFLLVMRKR